MRLLTVTHFFESHGGGIERVAGELCRALADAGHQSVWAASASDPAPDIPLVEPLPLRCANPIERLTGLPMPIPSPGSVAELSRAVRRADVVVIHDALYATSMIAAVAAGRAGKPTILIQHISGIPFVSTSMRLLMKAANGLVTQRMLRRADQVVFISDTVRRDFSHVRMRRPARLIFNGVDARTFSPGAGKREAFDLSEHGKIVAFVGRFVEKKGLAVLHEVARLCPEVCFALAGAGPIDPSAWGLANVRVLGPLSRRDVADLFRTSDVLLLPSVGEGYPLVIQEAMACGLPVICGEESARADPDAGQWLRGVTIDLRDPAATAERIVQAMSSIAQDAKSRDEMAKYAGTNYNWSRMVNEILEIAEAL